MPRLPSRPFGRNHPGITPTTFLFFWSPSNAGLQAMFAVRRGSGLDIVQDAMLKLAEKYGDRPDDEFPMLFQRILQNTIRDFYRRSKVRSMWTTLLSAFSRQMTTRITTHSRRLPPTKTTPAPEHRKAPPAGPDAEPDRRRNKKIASASTGSLPDALLGRHGRCRNRSRDGLLGRQRKTHCSRATLALASALSAKGIKL